ncbi:cytochrome b [Roseibium aggregatum]|uniref:cytochrome b n=1 Tax=Roseibium aggregatum TaxID=187304 RepID=UPI003F53F22C
MTVLNSMETTSRTDAHPLGPESRHAGTTRILHWMIAALVLATWPLGYVIKFVKSDVSLDFYLLHESFGFLVLWLMLVRVGNKLVARKPVEEGPALERLAASVVHGLLYLFLIVMPVSGFLATNAHGFPLSWFGLVPVWSPIGKSPDIAGTLSAIHSWSAWALLALFALHIGAVLFHHVLRRDRTLYRIL